MLPQCTEFCFVSEQSLTYITTMTRKDEMRKGSVARTYHLPEDLNEKLKDKKAGKIFPYIHVFQKH